MIKENTKQYPQIRKKKAEKNPKSNIDCIHKKKINTWANCGNCTANNVHTKTHNQ